MKKLMLLFSCFSTLLISHAQDIEAKIVYKATLDNENYRLRILNDSTIEEDVKTWKLQDISNKKPVNFHLLINGNQALYKSEYDMTDRMNLGWNMTSIISQEERVYYTNSETKEKFFKPYFAEGILVDLGDVDWTLTKESKKIGKYICYKATANIIAEQLHDMGFIAPVVAWYTPDIPTSFGIKTFNGLPGLTLELITNLESGKVHYIATEIDLNPKSEIKIKKPQAPKTISEEDYLLLIKDLNNRR
ncbi:GLPGLI family protein [Winogradskyella sp.]|uniref:GLPGLI family protein n=1 Tax=Winogradskyella sp. TaxID=1883156 RepID=UPI00260DA0DB|nr:GLPGLI family protein [Winogradskyella sp.]